MACETCFAYRVLGHLLGPDPNYKVGSTRVGSSTVVQIFISNSSRPVHAIAKDIKLQQSPPLTSALCDNLSR